MSDRKQFEEMLVRIKISVENKFESANSVQLDNTMVINKAVAMFEAIYCTATAVAKFAHAGYPPKRVFRKIDRRPLKRLNKKRALLQLMIAGPLGAMQVSQIIAQPVQKFPSGAPGIVGETGSEIINRTP